LKKVIGGGKNEKRCEPRPHEKGQEGSGKGLVGWEGSGYMVMKRIWIN